MNPVIVRLFHDHQAVEDLRAGLPYAFELAEMEAQRIGADSNGMARIRTGQEVGIHRERVIHGFLISKLGELDVRLPRPGDSQTDVVVGEGPLEIKTVTRSGLVTAKWTADTASARNVIEEFEFHSDMLLIRIWWGEDRRSVFYVPLEVLRETREIMPNFLRSQTGTNNRGVKFTHEFMEAVEDDYRTTAVDIPWNRSGEDLPPPVVRYTNFWLNRDYRPERRR